MARNGTDIINGFRVGVLPLLPLSC